VFVVYSVSKKIQAVETVTGNVLKQKCETNKNMFYRVIWSHIFQSSIL